MNYAATLALMVVLAFSFPIVLRLIAQMNLPEVLGTALIGMVAIFTFSARLVRRQVGKHRQLALLLDQAKAQVGADPEDARAYFVGEQHLGALLLQLGRRREAEEVIDRYSRLGGAKESEIVALREALSQASRRTRRSERD